MKGDQLEGLVEHIGELFNLNDEEVESILEGE